MEVCAVILFIMVIGLICWNTLISSEINDLVNGKREIIIGDVVLKRDFKISNRYLEYLNERLSEQIIKEMEMNLNNSRDQLRTMVKVMVLEERINKLSKKNKKGGKVNG